ncbi:hypothetical protein P168DRAFT_321132 [Aspergillus campestris IBT 28561]|uniref:Uncharacterized protein n=1 Tax=Aspergillus campestris (strain IBT 28561) TaxID=1392248 RepID=A0A2I1CV88_ASPC2|nr:uncharacterized protein P168DRAFT_321132 [Aspergillus campestris IBT 28561]PKY01547.1 hypothetical protein P168DRAFT_321132 [Aspergillus campestris IBT 28561]
MHVPPTSKPPPKPPPQQPRPDQTITPFLSPQYNSNRNSAITSTAPAPNGQGRPRLSPTGPGDCLCTDSHKPQPSCQLTLWPFRRCSFVPGFVFPPLFRVDKLDVAGAEAELKLELELDG